jgi:hypothetical protein
MDYSIDLAVDTSALVAVLLHEAEAEGVLHKLSSAECVAISAATKTELLMVVGSRLGMAAATKHWSYWLDTGLSPFLSMTVSPNWLRKLFSYTEKAVIPPGSIMATVSLTP